MNNKVEELVERVKLTPTEIGDALDLEKEGRYPCSDGSEAWTISVDALIEKQLSKVLNNPNLALIIFNGDMPDRIIFLAEALKEVK